MTRKDSPLPYWTMAIWWATWGAIRELAEARPTFAYLACLALGGAFVFLITRHMEGSAP